MHDEAADTASRIEAARVLLNQLSLLTVLEIEPMASSTHAGGVPFLVSRVGQAQNWAPLCSWGSSGYRTPLQISPSDSKKAAPNNRGT
jgi:hypothetical protein